jgi:hypothetical protein
MGEFLSSCREFKYWKGGLLELIQKGRSSWLADVYRTLSTREPKEEQKVTPNFFKLE